MNAGQLLVRGSIWPAILCGLAAILWQDCPRWPRRLWVLGLGFYLVHVAAAFGFVHGWSHENAFEHTRAETESLTGWDSGAGLYVNYAFTLAWLAYVGFELTRRSAAKTWPRRVWSVAFLFLAFNGAVVFARPSARLAGTVMFVLFLGAWCWRHRTGIRAWCGRPVAEGPRP